MNKLLLTFFIVLFVRFSYSQQSVQILPDEYWYGAAVNEGEKMPFVNGYEIDLNGDVKGNQATPLILSTKGRYIWSEDPFAFRVEDNMLKLSKTSSPVFVEHPGKTLREAYLAVSEKFFPAKGKLPDEMLFTSPQYNTWIELIYNQNQEDILKYSRDIIANGFPPGVIMIDDNWAPYYGRFEFRKDRFPDAKGMIKELHDLGFKVMIWVCPFIRPDSEESRFLAQRKWVVMDHEGDSTMIWEQAKKPAIVHWWNGFSMVMDFTNPDAVDWYQLQLDNLVKEYGVDGFKLDAGDPEFYIGNTLSYRDVSPNVHTELWGNFGLKYPLNEYRAIWKMGGEPLVQRLRDKYHTWEDVQKLIPHITVAGMLGYPFACPDMIGGGDYSSFLDVDDAKLDQELIVRSAQCHALMPMMQFSVAPWRVLDQKHLIAVKKAVDLRQKFVPIIMELAQKSAHSGEPIVSSLEYIFPHQGFHDCHDQFMLGEDIMIAPIVEKTNTRVIKFPHGRWQGEDGKVVVGPIERTVAVSLDELPWYRRITD